MRNYKLMVTFSILALALSGCGSNTFSFHQDDTTDNFSQAGGVQKNAIDILFVVDNSSSMSPLQNNLTSNFSSFISSFQAKGYDFHIAVSSTDNYKSEANFLNDPKLAQFSDGIGPVSGVFDILSTTPNLDSVFVTNATTGISGSGDERAFSSMRDALNSPLNAGFLRDNSFFAIIILSDEDDFSSATRAELSWGNNAALDHCYVNAAMDQIATGNYSGPDHVTACANQNPPDSVESYETYLDTLTQSTGTTRRYNVSAITVLDSQCQVQHAQDPEANVTIIGQRYIQMAQDTNGSLGSICDSSYAASLDSISSQIVTLATQFYLSKIPVVSSIKVKVNGALVANDANNGWTYNSAANSIQFHGSSVPALNATISISFLPDLTAIAKN